MRLIDADTIEYTHAIARCMDDGHNWNELCVTKDEIDDIPTAEPERTAKVMSIVLTSNPPQHVLKCGNCGGSIDKTYWRYCPHCGARLEWE